MGAVSSRAYINPACVLGVLTISALATCHATLYEDQHQSSSWLQMYMGDVHTVVALHDLPFVVAANRDQLVVLDQEDGTMMWRRDTQVDSIHVKSLSDRIISVSGSLLQAWRLSTGQLLWQADRADNIFPCCNDDVEFYWLEGQLLYALASADGTVLWSKQVMTTSLAVQACHVSDSSITVAAVDVMDSSEVNIVIVSKDGQHVKSTSAQFQLPVSSRAHLDEGSFVAISEDRRSVCFAALDALNTSAICHEIPDCHKGSPEVQGIEAGTLVTTTALDGPAIFTFHPTQQSKFKHLPERVAAATVVKQRQGLFIASAAVGNFESEIVFTVYSGSNGDAVYNLTLHSPDALSADGKLPYPLSVWAFPHRTADYQCAFAQFAVWQILADDCSSPFVLWWPILSINPATTTLLLVNEWKPCLALSSICSCVQVYRQNRGWYDHVCGGEQKMGAP